MASKPFFKHFRWAILWMILISILMMLPGSSLPKWSWINELMIDKWIHFGLYFVLSILLYYSFHKYRAYVSWSWKKFIPVFIIAALFGLILEVFQELFFLSRSFDWLDVTVNLLGNVFGGITLACLNFFSDL